MADDVYTNAVHRQPAPNINSNDKMDPQRLAKTSDANKMDDDNNNCKVLLHINSYEKTSTANAVEEPSAATTNTNNNNISECPPTPFTSNTTNDKASIQSYLEKAPTNTSSDDMVIDATTTPTQPPDRSTPIKRYVQRKTPPSQQNQLPSPDVPPIRPFILGQSINVSSLATAVNVLQAEETDERIATDSADLLETKSISSMDTSDVSRTLKPKSIFNPYAKQHRIRTHETDVTGNTTNRKDEENVDTYAQINARYPNGNTNNLAHNRAPLLPTQINSTNSSDPTPSKTQEHTQNTTSPIASTHHDTAHLSTDNHTSTKQRITPSKERTEIGTKDPIDQKFEELTQEEIEQINREITRNEQQDNWQIVESKHGHSIPPTTTRSNIPKDNNPYSVLQDDDTDADTTNAAYPTTNSTKKSEGIPTDISTTNHNSNKQMTNHQNHTHTQIVPRTDHKY
jgi:hypothetical protein